MNELLWSICILCLTALGMMFLLKKLNQPYLIAYMIAGIVLGPYGAEVFIHAHDIEVVGEIGILILMFYLGMEINVPDKRSILIIPVIAQSMKILLSLACAFLVGQITGLSNNSIILVAVLFVFNSTAVVSELLKKHRTLKSALGIMILNMLIFQDLLLAPVLTLLKTLNTADLRYRDMILPVIGCVAVFFVLKRIRNAQEIRLPAFFKSIGKDHDLQVFAGLLICLGLGLLAELIGLSSAFGSFIAGMMVGRVRIFNWLEHALLPFRVFFVTLFFVSVGLRLDIPYLYSHWEMLILGTFFVLVSNSVMSALIFRLLKYSWKDSWYGGALLSQTGEFGILALSIAYKTGIIELSVYKAGLGITCLSLLLSTVWIAVLKNLIGKGSFREAQM